MRIVTSVWATSPTGGVELNALQVSRELARRGHTLDLLYEEAGALLPEYRSFCRSTTRVKAVEAYFPAHLGIKARARMRVRTAPAVAVTVRRRPDVIYANRITSIPWAGPAAFLTRAPVVCHVHGFTDFGPDITAWLSRSMARLVIVSEFMANRWLGAGIPASKIAVVHNGIDPQDYPAGQGRERRRARDELGLGDDLFVAVYVGRLDPGKGVGVLLDAWRRLGFGPGEGRLLVVGSAAATPAGERLFLELTEQAAPSVQFVPMQRDVVPYLHAADVVVVPSEVDESFGRVVIEGLATGRPVVASAVGAIPEILTGEFGRFLFTRGDAEGLAVQLRQLVGWQQTEPTLGEACTSLVLERFTLARTVDRLEEVFAAVR